MNPQAPFYKAILQAERKLKKVSKAFTETKLLFEKGENVEAIDSSFRFSEEAEKLTLLARTLPAYSGHPTASKITEKILLNTIPVQINITEEGWFFVIIPALLPKKNKGSPSYIRSYLYPAMHRFFYKKEPVCYQDCVLIYKHVYDKNRPERQYRDHDNIELNMVTDIVAFYVMKDDTPLRCFHYYCSIQGDIESTEVYVVPQNEFQTWLEKENAKT